MNEQDITKELLEHLVFEEKMTDKEIADHLNVSNSKITGLRRRFKIKRKHKNSEWLIDQYCNKLRTAISIANECGVGREEIRLALRKLNIPPNYETMRQGSKKHDYDESVFDVIDSEEKAYWFGFIMGDGQIERFKRKRSDNSIYENYRLNMNIKYSDVDHLYKFLKFLKCTTKTIKKQYVKMPSSNIAEVGYLRISSRPLALALMEKGVIPNKSLHEPEPSGLPDHLVRHFIRGLLDADGMISNVEKVTPSATICDGKILMEWVQKQYPYLSLKKNNQCDGLYIVKTKKENVLDFLNSLYKDATVYLDRKYERYLKLKLKIESELARDSKITEK